MSERFRAQVSGTASHLDGHCRTDGQCPLRVLGRPSLAPSHVSFNVRVRRRLARPSVCANDRIAFAIASSRFE